MLNTLFFKGKRHNLKLILCELGINVGNKSLVLKTFFFFLVMHFLTQCSGSPRRSLPLPRRTLHHMSIPHGFASAKNPSAATKMFAVAKKSFVPQRTRAQIFYITPVCRCEALLRRSEHP